MAAIAISVAPSFCAGSHSSSWDRLSCGTEPLCLGGVPYRLETMLHSPSCCCWLSPRTLLTTLSRVRRLGSSCWFPVQVLHGGLPFLGGLLAILSPRLLVNLAVPLMFWFPANLAVPLAPFPPRLLARNDGMYLKALRWKRNFFLLAHVRVVLPQLGCPLCRSQPLGLPIRRLLVLSSTRLPHSNKALTLQLVADVVAHEWEWRNLIPRFRA